MIRRYWVIGLVTVLLLSTFSLTLLTGYLVAYRSIGQDIRKNTLPLTSDNVYSEIQKDLMLSIHISSLMASDTFVWDWVIAGEQSPERMMRYLGEIREKYNTVTAFFVSDITGRYYHPDGILKIVSPDDPHDRWYFRSKENASPYELNIDIDTADRARMTIFINYQVRCFEKELIGVTGVGLELTKVRDILNTYQEKYQSSVFFANTSGEVILHADHFGFPENLHEWPDFSGRIQELFSAPEASLEYLHQDRRYYLNSRFIPEFNLFLVILKDNDELLGRLKARLKLNLAIGLLITAVIAGIVFVILKNNYLNLEKLASVDSLTGAMNRNAFSLIFSQAAKDSARTGTRMSLALMDIDDFKPINDQYGHHCGDLVLKAFARCICGLTREADILCRWGGEEFVLLLRECALADARGIMEKIRKTFSEKDLDFEKGAIRVTFSAGIVEYRPGEELARLTDRADKLMYLAKSQGKNRILSEESNA